MIDRDNIEKAKELLWSYCEKCQYHKEFGCIRDNGVCEVDDAWGWLDASIIDD
jgi:hypothetical protein